MLVCWATGDEFTKRFLTEACYCLSKVVLQCGGMFYGVWYHRSYDSKVPKDVITRMSSQSVHFCVKYSQTPWLTKTKSHPFPLSALHNNNWKVPPSVSGYLDPVLQWGYWHTGGAPDIDGRLDRRESLAERWQGIPRPPYPPGNHGTQGFRISHLPRCGIATDCVWTLKVLCSPGNNPKLHTDNAK